MTEPSNALPPQSSPTTSTETDPADQSLDEVDEATALADETARLDAEDADDPQLNAANDTIDDPDPTRAVTVSNEDVEADAEQIGPAPEGTSLTPEEVDEIQRQVAEITAVNESRGPDQRIDLSEQKVN